MVADVSLVSYREKHAQRTYCNLPEMDAQCLAATYAPNARLLEQEAEAVAAQPSGHHRRDSSAATEASLRLQAAHERNRNASAALQLLYRIAASETAADNARKQLEEVRATLVDLSRLQRAGLDVPLSVPETWSLASSLGQPSSGTGGNTRTRTPGCRRRRPHRPARTGP